MRISDTLRKNKKNFIIYAILWLMAVIVFVMPFCAGLVDGKNDLSEVINISLEYIKMPFSTFLKVFTEGYIDTFKNGVLAFTGIFIFFAIWGTFRNASKGEYENIEHGSSDWCKNGEQYKILSRTRGIILAEDNYLPLDKRGNINVLVVGRFRFW